MYSSNTKPAENTVLAFEHGAFNPLDDLFAAQASKPAHWQDVNLRALSPFQRALLVIDGTVTRFIEAYTMEPVEVIRLSQEQEELSADHGWLEAPEGTPVLARQVLLRGAYSYTYYAYAASLIVPERLSEAEQQQVGLNGEGLGRILLSGRRETYRDVLWYGRERAAAVPPAVRPLIGDEFISRTYRIIAAGRPIMLINEKFPADRNRLPVHH